MAYYPAQNRYARRHLLKVTVSLNRETEPELVSRVEREPKGSRATLLKEGLRLVIAREDGAGADGDGLGRDAPDTDRT